METDRIIASIAAGQHAAVSRSQLLDAGVSRDAIGHRLRHGLLLPVHAGVYRVAGSPQTWHQRIMATTLACGPGAIASHRAAGFLHEMEGITPRLEVTVGRGRAPKPQGSSFTGSICWVPLTSSSVTAFGGPARRPRCSALPQSSPAPSWSGPSTTPSYGVW